MGGSFLLLLEHIANVDTDDNNDSGDHPDDDIDGGVVVVISIRLTERPHIMLCAAVEYKTRDILKAC